MGALCIFYFAVKLQDTGLELSSWSLVTDRIAQGSSIESLSLQ